jgi:hypothetical protein
MKIACKEKGMIVELIPVQKLHRVQNIQRCMCLSVTGHQIEERYFKFTCTSTSSGTRNKRRHMIYS